MHGCVSTPATAPARGSVVTLCIGFVERLRHLSQPCQAFAGVILDKRCTQSSRPRFEPASPSRSCEHGSAATELSDRADGFRLPPVRRPSDRPAAGHAPAHRYRLVGQPGGASRSKPTGSGTRRPAGPGPAGGAGGEVELSAAFVNAAAVFDEALHGGGTRRAVRCGLVRADLDGWACRPFRALGEAWAEGTVSVAAEHAASHAMLRRLSAAFEAAGRLDVDIPLSSGSHHEVGTSSARSLSRRPPGDEGWA